MLTSYNGRELPEKANMPLHDWSRVGPELFHDFHIGWVVEISKALNCGFLPDDFYSLIEQHGDLAIADVMTLPSGLPADPEATQAAAGALNSREMGWLPARRRTIAIRHVSGHRLVALVEIVSPANKDREATVASFAAKVVQALDLGVHVLVVDLLPPDKHDPHGLHELIRQRLDGSDAQYDLPTDKPLTLASYASGPDVEIYLEHVATRDPLPPMPLFLHHDRYIDAPLEATYQEAYRGVPAFWRGVLEGHEGQVNFR